MHDAGAGNPTVILCVKPTATASGSHAGIFAAPVRSDSSSQWRQSFTHVPTTCTSLALPSPLDLSDHTIQSCLSPPFSEVCRDNVIEE